MSNIYEDMCDPSIIVKVEEAEYNPMETSTTETISQFQHYHQNERITNLNQYTDSPYKTEIYEKMLNNDSVIDFIENSIDNYLIEYTKDKNCQTEKLRKGAERQRIYRQNETQSQRDRRLEMARQYIKKKRQTENHEERYERLKKQRERIRAMRETMKLNPDIYKMRKQIEAERMKMRRANESPMERMKRLEKSRIYSKKRRENEVYRILENEKNRLAHQYKRSDEGFRLQERQRDRARKKIKKEINIDTDIHKPEIIICESFTSIPATFSNNN